jgi:hypothetical protein
MNWITRAFDGLAQGHSRQAAQVRIPDERVLLAGAQASGQVLQSNVDYFTIQVNELYLDYDRKLWQNYTPSLWAASTFLYDGQNQTVPVVIGRELLGQAEGGVPQGMLYRNTRVVGPVPYKGGPISLSLVLSRVAQGNMAETLLSFVSDAVTAAGAGSALGPYLALAGTISKGISALLDLGSAPLVGVRDTVSPDVPAAGEGRTGWYALLDEPVDGPLWVIDGSLRVGGAADTAIPLRSRTYALYSLTALPRDVGRNDVTRLPRIGIMYELANELAARSDQRSYTAAKVLMSDLGVRMCFDPDLTRSQAERLFREWGDEIVATHAGHVQLASRGQDRAGELSVAAAQVRDIVTLMMAQP